MVHVHSVSSCTWQCRSSDLRLKACICKGGLPDMAVPNHASMPDSVHSHLSGFGNAAYEVLTLSVMKTARRQRSLMANLVSQPVACAAFHLLVPTLPRNT